MADVLGVARADLEQVTVVAGDVVQIQHLGALRQRMRDAIVAERLLAPDGDESQHRLLELTRIDQGGVALDDPPAFELANSLQTSGRGQHSDPGDDSLGASGIFLKKIQYCRIYFVYHSV